MVDPTGLGDFSAENVTTTITTGPQGQKFAEFIFGTQASAPNAILIYAADMNNNKYKMTHVNAGGDNTSYEVSGVNFVAVEGQTQQFESDLFTGFSGHTLQLDLAKANIDYVRDGNPAGGFKDAHAYIVFLF